MIIGVNGFKGSGKDTIGDYLQQEYGFERKSFAAKLKESAAAIWEIDPIKWEDWKNDPNMRVMIYRADPFDPIEVSYEGEEQDYYANTISVRTFLQRYGTEAHRDVFGSDFWVDYGLKGINPNKGYVFTDARFENELAAIKEKGGYNIRVVRGEDKSDDTHVSEVAPPPHLIDYQIENNGTIYDLQREVDEFFEFIKLETYSTYY